MYDFCLTFPYAALLAIGGLVGFLAKGSVPSLMGGLGSALILAVAGQRSISYYHQVGSTFSPQFQLPGTRLQSDEDHASSPGGLDMSRACLRATELDHAVHNVSQPVTAASGNLELYMTGCRAWQALQLSTLNTCSPCHWPGAFSGLSTKPSSFLQPLCRASSASQRLQCPWQWRSF